MPWEKASKELIELLERATADYRCDRKFMFGSPTFFINNNMFAGVHQRTVILRLSEDDREEIMRRHSEVGSFEPMSGRPMTEYIALPETLALDASVFAEWLERSYRYAASLPAREPKRRKK
jgi:TfoX/Sxy family transcriptional regulator of competence genes